MGIFKIYFSFFFFFIGLYLFGQQKEEIKLISPNSDNSLTSGEREGITWIHKNINSINVYYSLDSIRWNKIFSNIKTDLGIVVWKVPANLDGEKLLIKISSNENLSVFDISDQWISIKSQPLAKIQNAETSQIKTLKILPLGNSITYDNRASYNGEGDDSRFPEERTSYRVELYSLLTNRGIKFDFIGSEHSAGNHVPFGFDDNGGFPGITDYQLEVLLRTGRLYQPYYGIDEQVTIDRYLNDYSPDVILLHIGTNGNDQPGGTDPADVENLLDEIKRYEDSTSTPIMTILARIIDRAPNKTFVNAFNDNVEAMVIDRTTNPTNDAYPDLIKLVDMQDGAGINYIIDEDPNGINGDMNDVYHPNDKGYAKMAKVWFDGIISALPKLSAKIFLEGAYLGANFMNTDINLSGSIQNAQPFNNAPWNYAGTEIVSAIPENVVDWVLVSLRTGLSESSTVSQRAGFIKNDGTIVDLDGVSDLAFVVDEGDYYVVIEHRNHIRVMSSSKVVVTP